MNEMNTEDQELKELDAWMKSLPLKEVGRDFTSTVIASALLMQKRKRSMLLLVWAIVLLLLVIVATLLFPPMVEVSTIPLDVPKIPKPNLDFVTNFRDVARSFFADSRTLMFFVILEALFLLVILDQIAMHYRYIKEKVGQMKV